MFKSMIYRICLSLVLGLAGNASAAPPAVHPTTGEALVITCLKGTPDAIDGDLSDWNLEVMTPAVLDMAGQINAGAASWTGPEDCSAKFYLLWDDKNIYFGVVVKDDKLSMTKSGSDIWNADCIEVFFSTTNALAGHTEHYQWGFNANGQKWCWENMDGGGGSDPAYLTVASARTADGYICEVSLEYGGIQALNLTAGNTIGFHAVIDDTEATDREIQMTWTSREAHDQSLGFGYMILSSDPASAPVLSRAPSPAHKAVDVLVDAILSWKPGDYAKTHDVYFGTTFDDVNNASATSPPGVLVSQGQDATTYDPPGLLTFGQTYYWRVDEVNAPEKPGLYKGDTWSFKVEPYGYPVNRVKATASSYSNVLAGPEKTIGGSGLDGSDQHSTSSSQMWLSKKNVTPIWIQYEFDSPYRLYQMWVWNQNQLSEPDYGLGAMEVSIEVSTDGSTWTALANVPEFAQAPGDANYVHNTTVDFGGVLAKYVKLNILSNWGGLKQAGLSEVRFFYIPVKAFEPTPALGASDVALDTVLNWRPGREAAGHELYFGTDPNALSKVGTVTEHSYVLGSLALEYGKTYYWKVNEVNAAANPTSWEGDLWSFSTVGYAVVDDFESYNDLCNRIFWAWVDQYGYNASTECGGASAAGNGTGASVGNATAPYAEQTIVHSGRQSLPIFFNNTSSPYYSEAQREWASPQAWTGGGANTLRVYLRGDPTAFVETSPGTILMNGMGTDIWDVSDQFRFVYKSLKGNGSIMARVDSVSNTNVWAKAGVMIRETLNAGSAHESCVVTPGSGVSFQHRDTTDATSLDITQASLVAPYWVKITRNGNTFTAECSADGTTWVNVGTTSSTTVTMANDVYIGLAVTSHAAEVVCGAKFSNVTSTGGVSGSWQVAEIGVAQVPGNTPETCYVAVQDSGGKLKVVSHTDPTAIATGNWEEWNIPLSTFTSAGVSLNSVKKMIIGVGDRLSPKAGNTGKLYIDDIRLTRVSTP